MKHIEAYEYKDLSKEIQERTFDTAINEQVEFDLEMLSNDLSRRHITEEQYYNIVGCSKYYAETTSWFVPASYYENNEKEVKSFVKEYLKGQVFTKSGQVINV